jgi:hypothetical protein
MTQREALRIVEAQWLAELAGEGEEARLAYDRVCATAPVMVSVATTVFALRIARSGAAEVGAEVADGT